MKLIKQQKQQKINKTTTKKPMAHLQQQKTTTKKREKKRRRENKAERTKGMRKKMKWKRLELKAFHTNATLADEKLTIKVHLLLTQPTAIVTNSSRCFFNQYPFHHAWIFSDTSTETLSAIHSRCFTWLYCAITSQLLQSKNVSPKCQAIRECCLSVSSGIHLVSTRGFQPLPPETLGRQGTGVLHTVQRTQTALQLSIISRPNQTTPPEKLACPKGASPDIFDIILWQLPRGLILHERSGSRSVSNSCFY